MICRNYNISKTRAERVIEEDIIGIDSEHFSGNDYSLLLGRVSNVTPISESSHIKISLNPYLYLSNEMQRDNISQWNAIYFIASCPRTDYTTEFVAEMNIRDPISRYRLSDDIPKLINPKSLTNFRDKLYKLNIDLVIARSRLMDFVGAVEADKCSAGAEIRARRYLLGNIVKLFEDDFPELKSKEEVNDR